MTKLAIHGGSPVRATLLPYGRQSIGEEDIQAVVAALKGDLITTGPLVADFERAFADAVAGSYAVAVSNGTAALHAAAFAAGIGPGDEAIVPPMTFVATANCIRYLGGKVVFADVCRDTLNLDPAAVEAAITPRTRAIVTVDFAGQPSDLNALGELAERHDLKLIEDASHALGATYAGDRVGSRAHLTTFSLHPVKHVTTGEGGMITGGDPDLEGRLRRFRTHGIASDHSERGRRRSWMYDMVDLGFNYRLTDFQCALGMSQLRKLPGWLVRRREIAQRYDTAFSKVAAVEVPTVRTDRESAWHLYVLRLRLDQLNVTRAEVFEALRAENIGVNVHYIPVHWHSYYRSLGYERGLCPIAEEEYERLLSLPIFPAMTDGDVDDVIEAVDKVVRHFVT